jgi:iron-sulfur cluster repair protein YtfE (RIC family)
MTQKDDSLPAAEDYESMGAEEIEARLTRLREELEEAEDLRDMIVGQTGQHVPGVYVRRYAEKIQALEEAITAAENALAKKKR